MKTCTEEITNKHKIKQILCTGSQSNLVLGKNDSLSTSFPNAWSNSLPFFRAPNIES